MDKKVLYQFEKFINKTIPDKNIQDWNCEFGYKIIKRDEKGFAKEVEFNLYLGKNNEKEIYLIGDFNNWDDDIWNIEKYKLKINDIGFAKVIINNIKHKQAYKFLVIEDLELKYFQDPASTYFDDKGNCIFWDFQDPTAYKQKETFINSINRSTKILQTDLPGLISHYKSKLDKKFGYEINEKNYFNFIRTSGVIDEIKKLGFNTIQFLPFAQSIDGTNWKLRYLVPFQFAIQKNWGNPDDFAKMIDKFHKAKIAVIGDFVIGHLPYKDYNIFGQNSFENGLHVWKNKNNEFIYLKNKTSWGTIRTNLEDEFVRNFFISSCIHFLKYYKIDGIRVDNVDGILRYGDNGDGEDRPYGREFLRKLNKEIYSYNQYAQINLEAHYFHEDNAKMLVIPFSDDKRALGATAYNESRLTYYFHRDYMLKSAQQITVWKFKYLIDEKTWGQSNSTVSDFHNHDAAAGLMPMRCTGSYAYDSMIVKKEENSFHAIGKIKVMEAIISLMQEGRTLDLLQTHLLQRGTFEHDSSIHWNLKEKHPNKEVLDFKIRINNLMDEKAFWPIYVQNRSFLNLDEKNKIIIFEKFDEENKYVILINISSIESFNYKIPIKSNKDFKLIFQSDNLNLNKIYENRKSYNFELIDKEIELEKIGAYEVFVFKELK